MGYLCTIFTMYNYSYWKHKYVEPNLIIDFFPISKFHLEIANNKEQHERPTKQMKVINDSTIAVDTNHS